MPSRLTLRLLLLLSLALAMRAEAQDWKHWRGPSADGFVQGSPPTTWSEDTNVRWKVKLPGTGDSTPIVLGDTLYMTTAIPTDREGKPPEVKRPAGRMSGEAGRRLGERLGNLPSPTRVWEFAVLAVDRHTGKIRWHRKVKECVPHEGGHRTGSQASGSPVTDGTHIYAFFGSRGLHCLDLDGKVKWSKDFGYLFTRLGFGEGSTPALHGDTLVINWDHEGESSVIAVNKKNGKVKWRKKRDESTSWATPVVVTVKGRPQIVMTGAKASRGYDLRSGKLVWELAGMTGNCIPTPVVHDDIVFLMSGFRGAALQAVKLTGARGDLADSEKVLWSHMRGTSYVPSPLLYEGRLYFVRSNNGVLTCLDAKSGEVIYEGKRLAGLRTIYASPVGCNGHIYLTSRDGRTMVIKAGDEPEQVALNELDDEIDASPVIIGDTLYLRGRDFLYCIANTKQ